MIILKTEKEIEIMRQGGKRLARILRRLEREIKPGKTTGELEKLALSLFAQAGGEPAFKGYKASEDSRPYPTALCVSINDEVVHAPALPTRPFIAGDIVGIDIGMGYNGYYTDMAVTVGVGKISKEAERLIEITKKSLKLAIKTVRPNASLNDIGRTVEDYVLSQGFSVVRDLVGHGIGLSIHEEPQVANFSSEFGKKVILKEGMVLAIEPMVNAGNYETMNDRNGFTIRTADGSLSAHFEHTVAVTKRGHKILTE
jgi:methionyl aminopeptidase